jgi:hypothetical protein
LRQIFEFFNFPGKLATKKRFTFQDIPFVVKVCKNKISSPTASQIIQLAIQKSMIFLHIIALLASRDTFVLTLIVLKVGFLERNFERDYLAEKCNRT